MESFFFYYRIRFKSTHILLNFSVDAKFDEHDIPMDVIWLDIEHTDGKRYAQILKMNDTAELHGMKNLFCLSFQQLQD